VKLAARARSLGRVNLPSVLVLLSVALPARAQDAPPLPPLPPPGEPAPPAGAAPPAVPAPPAIPAPPAVPAPPAEPRAPAPYAYAPPPNGSGALALEAEPRHAPRYALWLGGGLGFIAYSGGFYDLPGSGDIETTGDYLKPGLAIQADAGARLARRYIPYLTLEYSIMPAGRRFDGGPRTTATTSFVGIGFRYQMGDVDGVSFPIDVSVGWRKIQVSNSTGTYGVGGLEILRLGVGVDVRLSSRWTISPMLNLSGGTLTDTGGTIQFADGSSPPYTGNGGIPSEATTTYFTVVVGCSAHADLLGK